MERVVGGLKHKEMVKICMRVLLTLKGKCSLHGSDFLIVDVGQILALGLGKCCCYFSKLADKMTPTSYLGGGVIGIIFVICLHIWRVDAQKGEGIPNRVQASVIQNGQT